MPFHRSLLAATVLLALTLAEGSARAAVTLGSTVTVAPDSDRGNRGNKQFNRADCAAGVQLTFPVTVDNGGNGTIFEIWVGTGCDTKEGREKVPAECWKVRAEEAKTGSSQNYPVSVRDIVRRATIENDVTTGPEVCDEAPGVVGSGPQAVQVAFVAMDTARTQVGFAKWELQYDLVAPEPPTKLRAGPGEASLLLTFDGNDATDADGFTFYCEVAGGTPPSTAGTGGAEATGGAQASGGTAAADTGGAGGTGAANAATGGDAAGNAAAVAGSAGDAAASGGASGSSGSGGAAEAAGGDGASGAAAAGTSTGSSADSSCTSSSLIPGQLAPKGFMECGNSSKLATSGRATNLQNGARYAVAAAAKDAFGNRGKLSALACETPVAVTGFFEAYRDAGGQAGGGFCSFSPPFRGRGTLTLSFALALGTVALLRRRQ